MLPPAHSSAIPRSYLWAVQVLLKDFGPHAEELSRRVKEESQALAGWTGRPIRNLASYASNKKGIARAIAQGLP